MRQKADWMLVAEHAVACMQRAACLCSLLGGHFVTERACCMQAGAGRTHRSVHAHEAATCTIRQAA